MVAPSDPTEKPTGVFCCSQRRKIQEANQKILGKKMLSDLQLGGAESDNVVCAVATSSRGTCLMQLCLSNISLELIHPLPCNTDVSLFLCFAGICYSMTE